MLLRPWQNSVASAQSGNYGQAAAHFGIMAAEQVLTVASLGTSASVGAVSRAGSTAVTAARVEAAVVSETTVTSWASKGVMPDLNPGRWVQLGEATPVQFLENWSSRSEAALGSPQA